MNNYMEKEKNQTVLNFLTTRQAAAFLGVSQGRLRNLTSMGLVPYYKLRRSNRYCQMELRALVTSEPRGIRRGN